jgi:hypothetical protein
MKRNPRRQGVVITEYHSNPSLNRRVAKWGPYANEKRHRKAIQEAEAVIKKLHATWPCTFLVKGYAKPKS